MEVVMRPLSSPALFLTLLLAGAIIAGPRAAGSPAVPAAQDFAAYAGKYPSDLFQGEPGLKRRLHVLLGRHYAAFMARLQTEMPIEKVGRALVVRGCMAHQCGVEEALLVINLADNKLHCGIRSERYGGKFKVFSQDPDHLPPAFKHATEE
jgi:hypothetical protein